MEQQSRNLLRAGPLAGPAGEAVLTIAASKILATLLCMSLGFTLVSGVMRLLRWHVIRPDSLMERVALLFDVNLEHNLPSYYSSILLLTAGGLLLYIALQARRRAQHNVIHWAALGTIFVFLSVDEMIELHEMLTNRIRAIVGATGVLYYAWVIPYTIFALAVAFAYLPFLRRLPTRTRKLFIISGAIFVTGAVGMEMMVGWLVTEVDGPRTYMLAALEEHVEEFMEMAAVSLFVYTLVSYIAAVHGGIRVTLRHEPQADTSSGGAA